MLELKAFVQESVHALDDSQLQLLSQTLRIDLRGSEGRSDTERILTGLLCLDKDTALGTFLTWLRTSEKHPQQAVVSTSKSNNKGFATTFVPPVVVVSPNNNNNNSSHDVPDHHLNDEIALQMSELTLLESDFKAAERHVHSGSPSFEKLKSFLVKLTKLRAKEVEMRKFFITQSHLLTSQHAQMKKETLHTRAQLDFFVDGFTNLRHRHDALLEKSTQMKAENEAAQELFLSMSANDAHFSELLHRTLLEQLHEKELLTMQLEISQTEIAKHKQKQIELESLISRLKQQRGDALKDANSYKRQLRKYKLKSQSNQDSKDQLDSESQFRREAVQWRGAVATVLALFREAIQRDTKSAKQSVCKEIVRTLQHALAGASFTGFFGVAAEAATTTNSKSIRVAGAAECDTAEPLVMNRAIARVVEKKHVLAHDIDQEVRGVVLLGGVDGEAEACATLLCGKLKYASVDLTKLLLTVRDDAVLESQQRIAASLMANAAGDGAVTTPSSAVQPSPLPSPPLPTVVSYLVPLKEALGKRQRDSSTRGLVLFNYELTGREANLLIGAGIPIDSVIDLKTSPPVAPKPTASVPSTPFAKPSTSSSKTPASSTRGAPPTSRPTSKASTPASPSRQSSRQPTAEPKKATTSGTSASGQPATARPSRAIDRKAAFAAMPHLFAQLEPVGFVEDRVELIVHELTRQKNKKATPYIAWDEDTSQLNESLLMYMEDIHMAVWIEQESRKPKKPGQDTTAATPSSTTNNTAAAASASSSNSSKAKTGSPSKAQPKGKAPASPTRGAAATKGSSSPTKSPAKPTAKPTGSPGKSQIATASKASSPKKPTTGGASSPSKATPASGSPGKRKA